MGQIRRAAAMLGVRAQPSLWLAPLPQALLLRDLPAPDGSPKASEMAEAGHAPIPFGLIDLLRLQRQQTAAIDLDAFGHLLAAGAPRSGRSQLLRTVATAAAASHSCPDLHLRSGYGACAGPYRPGKPTAVPGAAMSRVAGGLLLRPRP